MTTLAEMAGNAIHRAARTFAIVDVWDALRSERPYRRAWRDKQVKAYLKSLGGKHLDPQILQVFLRILEE